MNENIFNTINKNYNSYSKAFQKLSDYILQNYKSMPFYSIKELEEKSDVSTATITRFFKDLGFGGYSDFQDEFKRILQKEITPMKQIKYSIDKYDQENVLKDIINLNIETLRYTYSEELYKGFKNSIEILNNARKIYIIGNRSSYAVAYYFKFMLFQFMDKVELLSLGTGDIFDRLSYIQDGDVLFAISFSKYSKITSSVVDFFKERGNTTIVMTDSYSSPIATKTENILIAKSGEKTYSFVSAMTILNAMIIELGKIDKEMTLKMFKEKEKIAHENDTYN